MNTELAKKLIETREEKLSDIISYFKYVAHEGHIFGSLNKDSNDALSDIDIWLTFKDEEIQQIIDSRFDLYSKFGEVIMFHEAQQNIPIR